VCPQATLGHHVGQVVRVCGRGSHSRPPQCLFACAVFVKSCRPARAAVRERGPENAYPGRLPPPARPVRRRNVDSTIEWDFWIRNGMRTTTPLYRLLASRAFR
jgi:hypothetical protein